MSQTVDRALQILEFLGEDERELAEVADMLSVHKSTALRLLQTLEARAFVRHDAAHRYRLGTRVISLSAQALGSLDVRTIASTHLRSLASDTRQTVHLAAFDGADVFYIDKYEAQQSVRMYSRIGVPAPLYCTGVAKAILAELPENEQRRIADGIEYVRHTDRTIMNADDFMAALALTHRQGFAVDDREHEDYIHCIAMPLRTGSTSVTHGVSISATTMTLSYDKLLALLPLLRDAVAAIDRELG